MNSCTILLVDKDETALLVLATFLTAAGYRVVTAGDFDQALARFGASVVDLLLVDHDLGSHHGLDLVAEVRARGFSGSLLLMSEVPELGTAVAAMRYGAFDYLAKPVAREVLLRVVRAALAGQGPAREGERSRRQLEALFSSVGDAIMTVDEHLRILALNQPMAETCCFAKGAVGLRLAAAQADCAKGCLALLQQAMARRSAMVDQGFRCRPAGGDSRMFSLTATPLFEGRGRPCGGVLVLRGQTRPESGEVQVKERSQFYRITGKSQRMQQIYSLIEVLSGVDTTVLISGESGTGKELVAEALHYAGSRQNKPLVKVNCAALAENLLESELFGHVRGAFTGAVADKIGRFRKAHGGTIFLDEIGDISPALQVRLLRVLQEKEIERVGDSTPIPVDVRILAATHQDLLQKVRQGQFREDLYFRLKVVSVDLPPLRKRREDIPALMEHFRAQFNQRFSREIKGFAEEVLLGFVRYDWPGNVRELEHAIEHAFILCKNSIISYDSLPPELQGVSVESKVVHRSDLGESETLRLALQQAGGNKAKAARLLGVSRQTLYRRLAELELELLD